MVEEHLSISDGEVQCWIEQNESICLKAITSLGNPVELSADEARELAKALIDMAEQIDNEEFPND